MAICTLSFRVDPRPRATGPSISAPARGESMQFLSPDKGYPNQPTFTPLGETIRRIGRKVEIGCLAPDHLRQDTARFRPTRQAHMVMSETQVGAGHARHSADHRDLVGHGGAMAHPFDPLL